MKKIIYYIAIILITSLTFSCSEKTSEDVSKITYYPEFSVNGESEITLAVGAEYTDEGAVASEGGKEIPTSTVYNSRYFGYSETTLNTNLANIYYATYSATNSDGYSGTAERIINVNTNADFTSSIEGLYLSTVVRNNKPAAQYNNMKYVMVRKKIGTTNVFEISDAIGAYYSVGRGYGEGYAAQGMTIKMNDLTTNDFTFLTDAEVGSFGGKVVGSSFSVDAVNKTINFTTDWDQGFTFVITLTQTNF